MCLAQMKIVLFDKKLKLSKLDWLGKLQGNLVLLLFFVKAQCVECKIQPQCSVKSDIAALLQSTCTIFKHVKAFNQLLNMITE